MALLDEMKCKKCGKSESELAQDFVQFHIPTETCYRCLGHSPAKKAESVTEIPTDCSAQKEILIALTLGVIDTLPLSEVGRLSAAVLKRLNTTSNGLSDVMRELGLSYNHSKRVWERGQ